MRIKRLKKIQIGSATFDVKWDRKEAGGKFEYPYEKKKGHITIGTRDNIDDSDIFEILIHELKELIHCEQWTRHRRGDVENDYIFVQDHRQHTDMCARLAGLLIQFIE